MSENPWQQRNQIGKSSEKTRGGKYIKMGLFICCVSNTHLESRMNPQMPDTQFDIFLNVNIFHDGKLAMLSNILFGNKGKTNMDSSKEKRKISPSRQYPRIRPREGTLRKHRYQFFLIKLRNREFIISIYNSKRSIHLVIIEIYREIKSVYECISYYM